jgi:hemolysin activation/secretion protein
MRPYELAGLLSQRRARDSPDRVALARQPHSEEYTLLRDNALIGSMELRIPLVRGRSWADYFEVVPFTDVGSGWNASPMERVQQTLASVGAGLRWGATVRDKILFRPQLEIYWGHALTQVPSTGNTLQDHGWSFQFVVELAQN